MKSLKQIFTLIAFIAICVSGSTWTMEIGPKKNIGTALCVGALQVMKNHEENFLDHIIANEGNDISVKNLPEKCTICQDEIEAKKEHALVLACNHGYHERCIVQLAVSKDSNSNKCPLCRAPYDLNCLVQDTTATFLDPYFDEMLPAYYKEMMRVDLINKNIIKDKLSFKEALQQIVCSKEDFSKKCNTMLEEVAALSYNNKEPLRISADDLKAIIKAFITSTPPLVGSAAITAFFTTGLSYFLYQILRLVPSQSLSNNVFGVVMIAKAVTIFVCYCWLFGGLDPLIEAMDKSNDRKRTIGTLIAACCSAQFLWYGVSMRYGLIYAGFNFDKEYKDEMIRVFRDFAAPSN